MNTKLEINRKVKKDGDFVRLRPLLKKECLYNLLIGERSNGKTYCVLEYIIQQYCEFGHQALYLRRWDEDLKTKLTETLFDSIVSDGLLEKYSNGKYNHIRYYRQKWWAEHIEDVDGKEVITRCDIPIMIGATISADEHNKGSTYPKIKTIFFDEFLSNRGYLCDEVVLFWNTLSTYIRLRDDVTIFMCGNTINRYAPYFKEFGLYNIKNMKQGDIDVYTYGESGLRVGVYMTDSLPKKIKKSNVYFAFNNPRLSMITGQGNIWDIGIYPHCPVKYVPKDVKFNFFIEYDEQLFHAEIVYTQKDLFIFIHEKTTPLRHPEKDLIYSLEDSPLLNRRKLINRPITQVEKIIVMLFQQKKVFYQDNEVGNTISNYLKDISKIL